MDCKKKQTNLEFCHLSGSYLLCKILRFILSFVWASEWKAVFSVNKFFACGCLYSQLLDNLLWSQGSSPLSHSLATVFLQDSCCSNEESITFNISRAVFCPNSASALLGIILTEPIFALLGWKFHLFLSSQTLALGSAWHGSSVFPQPKNQFIIFAKQTCFSAAD